MDTLRAMYKKTSSLHHAYLLEGALKPTATAVLSFLEDVLDIATTANPDVYVESLPTLTIDDARRLKRFAHGRPMCGKEKYLVISFPTATTEAQNALLKVLEEPTESTHFFLIVPNAESLLPTLRSRLEHIRAGKDAAHVTLAEEFLKAPLPKRMKLISGIAESKNKSDAIALLDGLEYVLRKKRTLAGGERDILIFDEVRRARDLLAVQSSSVKMALEHVAMTVPSKLTL